MGRFSRVARAHVVVVVVPVSGGGGEGVEQVRRVVSWQKCTNVPSLKLLIFTSCEKYKSSKLGVREERLF